MNYWLIILLFFIVALLYSSVGFGGGSSYLAILAMTPLIYTEIRATALLCNMVVVLGNIIFYSKKELLNYKKIIPLVSFSIPFAFLGGYLKISQTFFFILLGITLLIAALTMWFSKVSPFDITTIKTNHYKNALYGSGIGFLSGLVGIGGGIFLAPLLHLTNWDLPKKIAATASIFILVNSIAGLGGQLSNPNFTINPKLTFILLISVILGGRIGILMSNQLLSQLHLKKATALLIAFISIRILITYLF